MGILAQGSKVPELPSVPALLPVLLHMGKVYPKAEPHRSDTKSNRTRLLHFTLKMEKKKYKNEEQKMSEAGVTDCPMQSTLSIIKLLELLKTLGSHQVKL